MYGADPRLAELGSKTGCRRLFGEVGVRYPLGVEDLHSLDEVADAIDEILTARPTVGQVIVKLNEGVSGSGNALVDLDGVASVPAARTSVRRSGTAFERMQLESPDLSFEAYVAKLESDGGIVEERIVGEELVSPSVQLRIRPDGVVELLSTHDQLLGGASGQRYLGCTFPADQAYSRLISGPAMAIGERLSTEGVLGRFAVDFVVVRDAGRRVDRIRDRAEPAEGRHHPSVPDPPVPDRWQVRRAVGAVPDARRRREAPRGDGSSRGR